MDTIRFVQGISIHPPDPSVFLYMDANHFSWGAHLEPMSLSFHGCWLEDQSQLHINSLEIMAICFALIRALKYIHHSCVMISTDNTTVVSYINKQGGTHSPDRIILVKLIVCQRVVTILSVYDPQSGLSDEVKDLFFDQLRAVTARIPASEFLIPCGDWKGHVSRAGTGYREVHAGMGYGRPEPDVEGERTLEYALAFNLLLGNTCFKKLDSHLITYKSGNKATQIDFILFRRTMRRLVTDVKVIPGEEVALQHQLLVCDMRIDMPPKSKGKFIPRLNVWKLKDPQTSSHF